MPKYNNSFRSPAYSEETIVDSEGGVVGTLRIKPSGLLWKPKGAQKFHMVSIEKFSEWITASATKSKRTSN